MESSTSACGTLCLSVPLRELSFSPDSGAHSSTSLNVSISKPFGHPDWVQIPIRFSWCVCDLPCHGNTSRGQDQTLGQTYVVKSPTLAPFSSSPDPCTCESQPLSSVLPADSQCILSKALAYMCQGEDASSKCAIIDGRVTLLVCRVCTCDRTFLGNQ